MLPFLLTSRLRGGICQRACLIFASLLQLLHRSQLAHPARRNPLPCPTLLALASMSWPYNLLCNSHEILRMDAPCTKPRPTHGVVIKSSRL